ncbi:hypothetical protein ACGFZQ_15005 [Streptomyces sp. NPDC048254]|uniref:hypothetical protein n=1 Tax=Streptomyces sp. NPDC048254 TaxID=3365525 RepID=UPI00371236FC
MSSGLLAGDHGLTGLDGRRRLWPVRVHDLIGASVAVRASTERVPSGVPGSVCGPSAVGTA